MAIKLEWSEEALEDIESIATYIEKDSPTYAKSVVSKFFEQAEIIKKFTELGRKVPELGDTNIREIFVYSYRLIYKIDSNTVLFVAVVHGKRLLENHEKSITKHST
ncbi:MAG: plasmid stabilization protein [Sulfurimonas sp. RIFCSPHIGHO2_12_FULL_36_9]|uniref:type II toxin-antitoxin system RelE/ParE family toxin n=1 Tax=Sulfurimonas sp. RIFCSPLOWO2_12_36_12 TaxID=1802253 RepID=UPI0008D0100C|nr:type II toxin-antitoxin system RelE/ParE family toxin [Sulfurimonas sp. RIFCSPLOWO2_12_36_12]OHD97602.1 MAG: plasmid stabilization protein [Sulfurimonas sp. RIFCSPHIGHO2_12_FULL_36_9]OHD98208.1 MAG: plasmid stabilization protein [Sulfurimonas sp. RIFCSPLOWO2_02_FULL_36_28]OHE01906.1 MAG: plasmid stabilization protein [Sulfurimonas sp. RIFCSPLOWO2_12_36_12]